MPYGWHLPEEEVFIPSQKGARLNIFGMIDHNNHFEGFSTTDSVNTEMVVSFIDTFSFNLKKNTCIVIDNASIHKSKKMMEMKPIWEQRGLFIFYLPPYSPQLNIAETLWRVLKGKWIRPQDYETTDSLFYSANRALAAVGKELFIDFSHFVT